MAARAESSREGGSDGAFHAQLSRSRSFCIQPLPDAFCDEGQRLGEALCVAMQQLITIQAVQFAAVMSGDMDFTPFDLLIHKAEKIKNHAKRAYIVHVKRHGCF